MKCVIDNHTDADVINRIDKYCWDHYRIYDSLWKLYKEVFKSYGPLSWQEYLSRIMDDSLNAPWKTSLSNSDGTTLDAINKVVLHELEISKGGKDIAQSRPELLLDEPFQTTETIFVFIDSEVKWGAYREFYPEEIHIKPGTEVIWKNRDNNGLEHYVISGRLGNDNSGKEFASESLRYGQSFKHTFNKKGTFEYYCERQGTIAVGRVIVY